MTGDEAQRAIDTARRVAAEFDRVGARHDANNSFPDELVPVFKRSGLAALNVPKRFGGLGADLWTTARCVQELARGDAACTLAFNMHLGVVGFFLGMWSEAHQQRFFTKVAKEQALLDGVYSEARAGVIGLPDTVAVPVEGGFRVSGRKTWGTLSLAADYHTFNVTITDADGSVPDDPAVRLGREVMLICPASARGVRVEKTWDAMGMRASGTHTVVFDNLFVPAGDLVSTEFRTRLFANLEWQSLTFASIYYGLACRAYDETVAILRKKSSGPVQGARDVQARSVGYVQRDLGELRVLNETTAATIENTARALMEGRDRQWEPVQRLGMLEVPKVVATENAVRVVHNAMRLVGGGSFLRGHILERLYRDARSGPFHPLTTDQTYEHLGKAALGLFDPPGAN
ncbi:MAG: acyl-CoA/acyl-ACP dehydrogenase [Nevskia sp.]|nr:acyl-CoA/acyl-ACP dehydrogenase [Nevskia sp.]